MQYSLVIRLNQWPTKGLLNNEVWKRKNLCHALLIIREQDGTELLGCLLLQWKCKDGNGILGAFRGDSELVSIKHYVKLETFLFQKNMKVIQSANIKFKQTTSTNMIENGGS